MTNCDLCKAIKDSNNKEPLIWNTCLYESSNFKILPTIGPLVEGHVIITSKNHSDGLAAMSIEEIEEFIEIVRKVFLKKSDLLITEHGSFHLQSGGACIVHTHIHLIPGFAEYYNVLDGILPIYDPIKKINDLYLLKEINSPYILNINNIGNAIVYKAYNAHSQMMRKAICNKADRSDWNWAENKKFEEVANTIKSWEI